MKKTAIFLLLLTIILSAPNSLLSEQSNTTRPGINDVIPVTALADAKMELVTPSAVLMKDQQER